MRANRLSEIGGRPSERLAPHEHRVVSRDDPAVDRAALACRAVRDVVADLGLDVARDQVPARHRLARCLGRVSIRARRAAARRLVCADGTVAALRRARARVPRVAGLAAVRLQLRRGLLGGTLRDVGIGRRALLDDRLHESDRRPLAVRHAARLANARRRGARHPRRRAAVRARVDAGAGAAAMPRSASCSASARR